MAAPGAQPALGEDAGKENSCGNLALTPSKATPSKDGLRDAAAQLDSSKSSPDGERGLTDNPVYLSPTKSPFNSLRKDSRLLAAQLQELREQLGQQQAVQLVLNIVDPPAAAAAAGAAAAEAAAGTGAEQQLQRSEALVAELSSQAGQLKGRIAKVRPGGPCRGPAGPGVQRGAAQGCGERTVNQSRPQAQPPPRCLRLRLALQLEGAVAAGEAKVRAQAGELEALKAANAQLEARLAEASAQVGVTPERSRSALRELADKAERWGGAGAGRRAGWGALWRAGARAGRRGVDCALAMACIYVARWSGWERSVGAHRRLRLALMQGGGGFQRAGAAHHTAAVRAGARCEPPPCLLCLWRSGGGSLQGQP